MTISGISESRTGRSAALPVGGAGACMLQAAGNAKDKTASARPQTFLVEHGGHLLCGPRLEMPLHLGFTVNCEL